MMRFLRFIVFSDIWVGVAVAAFTCLSYTILESVNYTYVAITFFSTVAAYNYMRIVERVDETNGSPGLQVDWMQKHLRQAVFFTVLSLIAAIFLFIQIFNRQLFFLLLAPFCIAVLYPVSFKHPFGSFTSLRMIPGLKLLLIAFSWSYVTYLIPALTIGEITAEHFVEFSMRIVYISALVIPFDMRDIKEDKQQMQTLPQRYGLKNARNIALACIFLYAVWKVLQFTLLDYQPLMILPWLSGLLFSALLIYRMKPGRSYLYCGFWVESSPVVIFVLILIIRIFIKV